MIKARKIRYEHNKQDYQYSRKLDDKLFGREYELSINIITPFNENASSEQVLRMQNIGRNELMIIMPAEDRLMRDLVMYKKTEKYVRQNMSMSQVDSTKRILSEKSYQNSERLSRLQEMIKDLAVQSKLLAGENEIEIISADAQSRIFKAFQQLIARAYPNLRMLRDEPYTENAIASVLAKSEDSLFANDATSLAESEQEVFAFVQSNNRGGVRTTLKGIIEQFEKKPYGWYYAAILCTIASLCARGKVELRNDSNLLSLDLIEA